MKTAFDSSCDASMWVCSREVLSREVEVVERKGVGHPDTLADAIAEQLSRRYSLYMQKTFGGLAHHWFDKVLLVGGTADIDFGRGELTSPYRVLVAGKAVLEVEGQKVPLAKLLREAAVDVLSSTLDGFDDRLHLRCGVLAQDGRGPGQPRSRYSPRDRHDLVRAPYAALSNDCNLCCGWAPLSQLEKLVLATERFLTSAEMRRKYHTGTDVKVVGQRHREVYHLLVNLPFLARHILSWNSYLNATEEVLEAISAHLRSLVGQHVNLTINPERQHGRAYLTVTGSVADTGDVGVVGRGNRINGLITPMRPMSIEASCGKNPLDHTGKLYGVLADRIARDIYESLGVAAEVFLTSHKGHPVDKAVGVVVNQSSLEGEKLSSIDRVRTVEIVARHLSSIRELTSEFIAPGVLQW